MQLSQSAIQQQQLATYFSFHLPFSFSTKSTSKQTKRVDQHSTTTSCTHASMMGKASHFIPVAAGGSHSLVLTEAQSERIVCCAFGTNKFGQLGTSANAQEFDGRSMPVPTEVIIHSTKSCKPCVVSCGTNHSLLLTIQGELYTWGSGEGGKLGLGNPSGTSNTTHSHHTEDSQLAGSRSTSMVAGQSETTRFNLQQNSDSHRSVPIPTLIESFVRAKIVVEHVSCGSDHTLCIDSNGDLWSWGMGMYGNLGHGDSKDRWEPTRVAALQGASVALSSGGAKHSSCVTTNGQLFMWGHGDNGRLGFGTQRGSSLPNHLEELDGRVSMVSCGEAHTTAVLENGRVYSWGCGTYGRLGHGEETDVYTPMQIMGLSKLVVASVASGVFHTLALTQDGEVFSWGGGQNGKLGTGDTSNRLVPNPVTGLPRFSTVVSVAAGPAHSLCVTQDGTLYAWGSTGGGRLGIRCADSTLIVPTAISSGIFLTPGSRTNSASISTISQSVHVARPTELLTRHQQSASMSSRSRSNTTNSSNTDLNWDALRVNGEVCDIHAAVPPTQLRGVSGLAALTVRRMSCGAHHSMAVTQGGALFAWGGNMNGQLGIGSRLDCNSPVQVEFGNLVVGRPTVVHVACGMEYTLCAMDRGDVFAWGRGTESQLGTGNLADELSPSIVQSLQGRQVVAVAAGEDHSAAVTSGGELYTWGSLENGKLGQGHVAPQQDRGDTVSTATNDLVSLPVKVKGKLEGEKVIAVSLGMSHSACITLSGQLFTWGGGWYGRLGGGTYDNQYSPMHVSSIDASVKQVSCGAYHTLAVTVDGKLYSWGRGDYRLGLGNVGNTTIPTPLLTFRTAGVSVVEVVAGEEHSVALGDDGSVWSWGKDTYGKLGRTVSNTTKESSDSSRQLNDVSKVLSDFDHGPSSNNSQHIGSAISLPVQIRDLSLGVNVDGLEDIRSVTCKSNHSFAISQNGKVFAWGCAGSGRLGIGQVGEELVYRNAQSVPFFNSRTRDVRLAKQQRISDSQSTITTSTRFTNHHSGSVTSDRFNEHKESVDSGRSSRGFSELSTYSSTQNNRLLDDTNSTGQEVGQNEDTEQLLSGLFESEAESAVRESLDSDEPLPIWAVQSLLKSEPGSCREGALRTSRRNVQQREAEVYQELKRATLRKQQVLQIEHSLQHIIASTLRKLGNVPEDTSTLSNHDGMSTPIASGWFQRLFQARKVKRAANSNKNPSWLNANHEVDHDHQRLNRGHPKADIVPHLPRYTTIFTLFLCNPVYLANIHKVWVVDGHTHFSGFTTGLEREELFMCLVKATYDLNDAHSVHLYLKLCELVLLRELKVCKEQHIDKGNQELVFSTITQPYLKCRVFRLLAQHLANNAHNVREWLQGHLRGPLIELLHGRYAQTESGQDLDLEHDAVIVQASLTDNRNTQGYDEHGVTSKPTIKQVGRSSPRKRAAAVKDPRVKQEIKCRLKTLTTVVQNFLGAVLQGVGDLPMSCRWLCAITQSTLTAQFQGIKPRDVQLVVGKLFLDTILKDAVEEPHKHNILPRSFGQPRPLQLHNLAQVWKLIRLISLSDDWNGFSDDISQTVLTGMVEQSRAQLIACMKHVVLQRQQLESVLLSDVYQEVLRASHETICIPVPERVFKFARYALFHPTGLAIAGSDDDPLYKIAHGDGGLLAAAADRVRAGYFVSEIHDTPLMSPVNIERDLNFLDFNVANTSIQSAEQEYESKAGESLTRRGSAGRRWSCSSTSGSVQLLDSETVVSNNSNPTHPKEKLMCARDVLVRDVISQVPLPSWMQTNRTETFEHFIKQNDTL